MFLYRLRKRTEYDALLGQSGTEGGGHGHRVEYGIHSDTGKCRTLMKGNSELVECLLKFRIYLLRAVLILLGSRIIYDVLKINFRNVKMGPCRESHLLPAAECLQTELEHPFRLVLLGRNQTDYVFIQALGNELLLDIRHKAVLIFLFRETI